MIDEIGVGGSIEYQEQRFAHKVREKSIEL